MLVIAVIFLLLVVVFAVQNAQMVSIVFMGWAFDINLALVVLGSACIGVLVGAVWVWFRHMGIRAKVKSLAKELQDERDKATKLDRTLSELDLPAKERDSVSPKNIVL